MKTLLACGIAIALAASSFAQRNLSGTPEIELALERLNVVGSVLMIAAHPDDENTAALAYWARGRKLRTAYLSATRGEGGQNLIGSEQGDLLGVIRTQELLAARRIDGAEQFFTRAIDFGFTKTPDETLEKWGHDQILSDMVWVIRRYQPDVIVLRFSGTPRDGHGQHQASAILGKEAYFAAADPTRFPEQLKFAKPWKAKRLMWNAFAFTPAQEKEAEKLPARIEFDTGIYNPVLGKSYGEIAGISRSEHRSQGMGSPENRGPSRNFLTIVAGDAPRKDLFDDIDITWKRLPGGARIGELLAKAAAQFAPEHPEKIVPILLEARPSVAALAEQGNLWGVRKLTELDEAISLCSGLWVGAEADRFAAVPGGKLKVTLTAIDRSSVPVSSVTVRMQGLGEERAVEVGGPLAYNTPLTKTVDISVPANQPVSQPFWLVKPPETSRYSIEDPLLIGRPDPVPVLTATFQVKTGAGQISLVRPVSFRYVDRVQGELTRPLTVVPAVAVDLPTPVLVFTSKAPRRLQVQVKANVDQAVGDIHLEADAGWRVEPSSLPFRLQSAGEQEDVTFTVTPTSFPDNAAAHFHAFATIGGAKVESGVQTIVYTHIPTQTVFYPSSGALRVAPLTVLAHKIGYIMGAGDEVPEALRQMGCDVTLLSENDLTSGDLSAFDAIVTGVRAYNVRADLRANQPRLLQYVKNGGTMVVQYNVAENRRFSTGADSNLAHMGPYPFTVGGDRVTVEEAPVEFLNMKNPVLRAPNVITSKDFEGWVQERGLYFASQWDPHYETVFSSHDPKEKDLPGGTLFTRYGKGVYIFSSYSWFRQLPAGVPGAYRIFANLLSAGKVQ